MNYLCLSNNYNTYSYPPIPCALDAKHMICKKRLNFTDLSLRISIKQIVVMYNKKPWVILKCENFCYTNYCI